MQLVENSEIQRTASIVGLSILATIIVGIVTALFIAHGIDVNLTADAITTAENMMEAETRVRAKAYIALFVFALTVVSNTGLYLILKRHGQLLALWSLFVGLGAASLALMGSVYAMNAAEISSNTAYAANTDLRILLTGIQTTSDYTSFHLSLIISSASMAGFFYLFLKSGLMPKIISAWGLFASIFVASAMVGRDFIPALGHNAVTGAFMVSNLVALVATGTYLAIRGVRQTAQMSESTP